MMLPALTAKASRNVRKARPKTTAIAHRRCMICPMPGQMKAEKKMGAKVGRRLFINLKIRL
jgi:hypothetical protein